MRKQPSLFSGSAQDEPGEPDELDELGERSERAPLAERMRPQTLDGVVGQERVLGPDAFLGRMLRGSPARSCILWGPPGSGKTTIARLLANRTDCELETFSAVLSGVKELREVVARAARRREIEGRGTILFVDEIHRFNKAQQDAFLPHVEAGTIVLVGATTENPSFELTGPLLSRCRVVVLDALEAAALKRLIDRALVDAELGLGTHGLTIADDARAFIAERAAGDARSALGALEAAADLAVGSGSSTIDLRLAEEALQRKALLYDKAGDEHYNVVSAFIKSMRGSDPDAALYWLARMLEAGEDPLFIARRMVIFASEDVGLADPQALPLAIAVKDAVHFVGLPEARINLAHGAAYLALAPKSNTSYRGLNAAAEEVRRSGALPVPLHLRNAPTRLMKGLGYGRDYVYPHGRERDAERQGYLPDALAESAGNRSGRADPPEGFYDPRDNDPPHPRRGKPTK
jgi:putative ATPase